MIAAPVQPETPAQPSLPLEVTPAQPVQASPEATPTAATYTVRSGDTLSDIALRHHIKGGWPALYEANRDVVENPNLIYPGEVLRLP